ncbi:MAG: cytochrome P450 [Candidatus Devosia euplotis]|nr:cytochrome P450 [Candidatus Devosia euplotis]
MAAIVQLTPYTNMASDRRVGADPGGAQFVQNPYRLYDQLHVSGAPAFWDQYGHWVFSSFKNVSALLRDKRFGREILHVATREQIGMPAPKPHTAAFDLTEKYSLLNLEPPSHTRLRTLVNRAFFSCHVEQLRSRILKLAN